MHANAKYLAIFFFIMPLACLADRNWIDAPYERNFKYIPKYLDSGYPSPSRWISLERINRGSATELVLGRGKFNTRNRISSKKRLSDNSAAWDYAYFAQMIKQRFFIRDAENSIYFAVVPIDTGNSLMRRVYVYKLKDNQFTELGSFPNYFCPDDKPVFKDESAFTNWLELLGEQLSE
jgi:hypothetical protein